MMLGKWFILHSSNQNTLQVLFFSEMLCSDGMFDENVDLGHLRYHDFYRDNPSLERTSVIGLST